MAGDQVAAASDGAETDRKDPIAAAVEERLKPLADNGKARTSQRWWAYTGALLFAVLLNWVIGDVAGKYAPYIVIGAPAFALALYVVILARREATDFGSLIRWLEAESARHRTERFWQIAADRLPTVEATRAHALANGAAVVVITAYAVNEFYSGGSTVLQFYGYFSAYVVVAGFAVGAFVHLAKAKDSKSYRNLAGAVIIALMLGAVPVFYLAQVWSTGSEMGFGWFALRFLASALFGAIAGFLLGMLGVVASAATEKGVIAIGRRLLHSLPPTAHRRIDMLLHKVRGQSIVLWIGSVGYMPVFVLASEQISPIVAFGVGFLAFAGIFFAVVIWSSVDVRAEQFGTLVRIVQLIMAGLALNFSVACIFGYAAGRQLRALFDWCFGDLGAVIFPDVALLAFSTPFWALPFVDLVIGVMLAAAALYPLSYVVAVFTRKDGLRILMVTLVGVTLITSDTLVQYFGLALPDPYVAPIARYLGVSVVLLNQAIIVAVAYLLATMLQAALTRQFNCSCGAPAPYQHVSYCWRCGEQLDFSAGAAGRPDEKISGRSQKALPAS